MALKEASWKDLSDRTERAKAKLAKIAHNDCWFGGARALVLLKRLKRSSEDFESVVYDVYHASNGISPKYWPYHCPECGSVVMGEYAAYKHCY